MAKALTQDEKIAYINANRSLVPSSRVEWFNTLDTEKQYKKVRQYVRKASPVTSRMNVKTLLKQITSTNPSTAQVNKLIEGLQEWVNNTTQRQIEEIDHQIELLNKQKQALSK